jgi:branched-chain amino acid transport system substrate-binding protein
LSTCFALATPASDTTCANQAVDAKPDVIMYGAGQGDNVVSAVAKTAGIPFFAYQSFATSTLTSNLSWVINGLALAQYAEDAQYAKDNDLKSVALMYTNVKVVQDIIQQVQPAYTKTGITLYPVPVPPAAGDMTPQFSAAMSHNPGIIHAGLDGVACVAAMKAKQLLSYKGVFIMGSACNTPAVFAAGGSATEGSFLTTPDTISDKTEADTKTYLDAMNKYAAGAANIESSNATSTFEGIVDLARVFKTASSVDSISATSIPALMSSAKNVPMFMGGKGSTFTCDGKQVPGLPALCAASTVLSRYTGGELHFIKGVNLAPLLQ